MTAIVQRKGMNEAIKSAYGNTGFAFRYSLAIFAAAAALFLRYLLAPLLGNGNPYHTVWLAVVFSAWYCGLGPSIVSTLLGTVGVWYWFLSPHHSFAIQDRSEVYGALGFLLFSSAIIALGSRIDAGSPLGRGWALSLSRPTMPSSARISMG
jgi:K+-sensing histidine kinase KdpD